MRQLRDLPACVVSGCGSTDTCEIWHVTLCYQHASARWEEWISRFGSESLPRTPAELKTWEQFARHAAAGEVAP